MQNQYRLGIDAGGTFTDFILADRKGGVRIFKALSTPNDPTAAIRNGLALIQEETGLSPAQYRKAERAGEQPSDPQEEDACTPNIDKNRNS